MQYPVKDFSFKLHLTGIETTELKDAADTGCLFKLHLAGIEIGLRIP